MRRVNGAGGRIIGGRAAVWLERIRVMTVKELLQFSRDGALILFMIYAFTLDIYLAGSGVRLELSRAVTVVLDDDRSFSSRELTARFGPPSFEVVGKLRDGSEGSGLLDRGEAMVVIDIPPRFEESLRKGSPTSVQVRLDASNSVLGSFASSYSTQIVSRFGLETALERLGAGGSRREGMPGVMVEPRVWFNPTHDNRWFMSIAELLNIVTLFAMLLPASAMVREKERGTLEQLLVSPLNPFQVIFPKVLSMAVVILAGTGVSLFGILKGCFGVPVKGSLHLYFMITLLYIFAVAGLGVVISTVARNLAQAGMLTIITYGPMIFLSGAWTPPEAMPEALRLMMRLSPLYYYIDASFGVLLKGAGLSLLWDSVMGIALLGGLLHGVGLWRLRGQFR
ncbi:MAG: ABC transporter permease [Syntrophobacteraceae bacterium]|jgi:ABC-2 type transport system permease protein|nr:ABC transporter permease [Syntrophobacteraceae bacterium]